MTDRAAQAVPRVLFFNINGVGMGHMSTCLAYARRMRDRAKPVFFSLSSAIERIHDMGFEAEYFVSPSWSRATPRAWNRQLAVRLGMTLERVRPSVVVFDGNWPYHGLFEAAAAYGMSRLVWSNLTLYKGGVRKVPVSESQFDLVIRLGEPGARYAVEREEAPGRKVAVPPVTMLGHDELLERDEARRALGLRHDARYALFSLGAGNLNDVGAVARGLVEETQRHGYTVVWARSPISVRDVALPENVLPISTYPLSRYMRAFDAFVGAAGYNTCCEVIQSGVPTLFVPNTSAIDDQARRARLVAQRVAAVVSPCETPTQRAEAVSRWLALAHRADATMPSVELNGAELASNEILTLID